MLQFRDLKVGYPIFIFDRQKIELSNGSVVERGFPRYDTLVKQNVIDLVIDCNGKKGNYTVPDSAMVTDNESIVIATETSAVTRYVQNIIEDAEQVINSVEQKQKDLAKAKELLPKLDPAYKQKFETEKRFQSIESTMADMRDIMKNQQDMFNKFLNSFNPNTKQP